MAIPHFSVLLKEILRCFENKKITYFMDATLGAGGHSEEILKAHPEIELLIGIDQDPLALEIASKRLLPWKDKIKLIKSNFANFHEVLKNLNLPFLDGMLFDLGVSSMQLDLAEKGFSFMREGPLDMRMDPHNPITAADVVNFKSEQELGKIFRDYGEEKRWRSAARAICLAREEKLFTTTKELADVLRPVLFDRKKTINPLTLVFQGLRIFVNNELNVIETALPQAISHLAKGGRLAVISFHSLEDRIVKNIARFAASDKYDTSGIGGIFLDKVPEVELITRKPIIADEDELLQNPRSRSAKLRIVEKK